MGKIIVGTSGYSYKEWVGAVYPEGTRQDGFLRAYSELFDTVELNFSYFQMPQAVKLEKMLIDGGPSLTFSIKAYKTLTHEINEVKWKEEAKVYREAIEPLVAANRLEAVLFEFPFSFHYNAANREYLGELLEFFEDVPRVVEFRKADWFSDRVFEGLTKRGVTLASLDMPEGRQMPPSLDLVTAKTAYIRFHGRNSEEVWWGSDATARYDYLYSEGELEAWADRIAALAVQVDKILVYFNNHAKGKAARNAIMLMKILQRVGLLPVRKVEEGGKEMMGDAKKSGDLPF